MTNEDNADLGAPLPGKRATIKDVAERAGVSRSTASRALTGHGYVAAPVKNRVTAAARALRYVPDAMARHLKQQTSKTIGLIVSDLRNPFYAELAAGAGHAARAAGYTMFLSDDSGLSDGEARSASTLVELRVAGVIVTPVSEDIGTYLRQHAVPVVEVDRQFAEGVCDAVIVDNRSGSSRVSKHLIEQGHRRIALMIDETDWTTGRDRHLGYQAALAAAGLPLDPELVVSTGWSVEAARNATLELLRSKNRPTAIFTANNVLAEGAYRAIAEMDMTIPDDVSLVSFDDAPWMSMVRPGITAVAQDASALGEAAVARLLGRIASPDAPPTTVVLSARLLSRGSTGAPPA